MEGLGQHKTQVGAVNRPTRELLENIQKQGKDPDWDNLFFEHNGEEVKKMGADIYNLMVSLMGGGVDASPWGGGEQWVGGMAQSGNAL